MTSPSYTKFPQFSSWQQALRESVRHLDELLRWLHLDAAQLNAERTCLTPSHFPLRVPHAYVARMQVGNPDDPLLRQVLPLKQEQQGVLGFVSDPVGDKLAEKTAGLLHKYQGRVLIISTGSCAIHCRYCFRRHYPYAQAQSQDYTEKLAYIQRHPDIQEVILSGGDPLLLSDERLHQWVQALSNIAHVKTLRLHTRLPIVLPQRISEALLQVLRDTRLQVVMVIHANHAQEFDAAVAETLKNLRQANIMLLNQAVLLRGVNHSAAALLQLHKVLGEHRVMPYYLHLLDTVAGAAHFEVSEAEARPLMQQLHEQLPGYLVPKLVREVAGVAYKQIIY